MKTIQSYLITLCVIAGIAVAGEYADLILAFIAHTHEHELLHIFFTLSLLFILSFFVSTSARLTKIPSFVFALLFGIIAKPLLLVITENNTLLSGIVAVGATLILFGGGIEVPYKNFMRLSPRILSLSFVGLLITSFLFSQSVSSLNFLSPVPLSLATILLLGVILSSTDPAAIIPILRGLKFKNRDIKDIIISESAVTDVTGTLLTNVFLGLVASGIVIGSVSQGYASLLNGETVQILLSEVLFGIGAGAIGFFILELLHKRRKNGFHEDIADITFFLGIPVFSFFVATLLGGSGYLAAFITGLIMHLTEHLQETEHFFNHLVEAFLKPIIFIVLGALVHFDELFQYAGIGIATAIIFMCIIRPLSVFISLSPWFFAAQNKLTFKEAWFISSVRETGAIPAVLLVSVVSSGIGSQLTGLVPIGMWVIIATLVIQPPLTPLIAKWLNVGEEIGEATVLPMHNKPSVLLASRGHSHLRRLPKVMNWAAAHGASHITVLICPEDEYTEGYADTLRESTFAAIAQLNKTLTQRGFSEMESTVFVSDGLLHDHLKKLCKKDERITVLFVGKRVLDFRLSQIKALQVPFFFID